VSGETFEEKVEEAKEALESFDRAPFTVQRFAEILVAPGKQHRNVNKLLNGYGKLLSVTSTVARQDPAVQVHASADGADSTEGMAVMDETADTVAQEPGASADAMDIA
jgi:hypothetical protein